MAGSIYATADAFRQDLLRKDRGASTRILQHYGQAWLGIKGQLDELDRKIQAARDAGQEVGPSWLFQQDRLGSLKRQTQAYMLEASRYAAQETINEQRDAIASAQRDAKQLATHGGEAIHMGFSELPDGALHGLIGTLGDGSPLRTLFDGLGNDAGKQTQSILVQGVASGWNLAKTARAMREYVGGNATRAMTIARTETLRSYREASRLTYAANPDLVSGWIWRASHSLHTCPACLALSGTVHKVEESLHGHPNCRCYMVPITNWSQTQEMQTGPEWFDNQPASDQRKSLGPGKYDLYKSGKAALEDFAKFDSDPEYGGMWREASIKEAQAGDTGLGDLDYLKPAEPTPSGFIEFQSMTPAEADIAQVEHLKLLAQDVKTHEDAIELGKAIAERIEEKSAGRIAALQGEYDALDAERIALSNALIDADVASIELIMDTSADAAEKLAALRKQLDELQARLDRIKIDQARTGRQLDRVRQSAILETLGEVRPMGGPLNIAGRSAGNKYVREVSRFFPRDWIENSNNMAPSLRVEFLTKKRAHYSPTDGLIRLGDDDVSTAAHELMHRMEDAQRKVKALERSYYESRTSGERLEHMGPGYRADEVTRRDEFVDAYMGKDYGGQFYELMTMGVEGVYYGRYDLWRKDVDYIRFVLGVLAGA